MAKFKVTGPDGHAYNVTAPDGATPEQVLQMVQQHISTDSANPESHTPTAEPISAGEKFAHGMMDPINGGAQLLTHILPDSVVQAGNQFNNWLADKTGLVAKLPEGGVDQQVREGEKAYQDRRKASGDTGFDWARLGGNVLNPVTLGLGAATLPARGASLLARTAWGAGSGAASGALAPVTTDGDYTATKLGQIGMGAGVGAALPGVLGAAGRVISPKASTNPNLDLLLKEGVKPTIGQTLGGAANAVEEKAMSIPLVGDMIARSRNQALGQFNTAAINRTLAPVGQKITGSGQDAVKKAGDILSQGYDDALSAVKFIRFDNQFSNDLNQLAGMAQNLEPRLATKFQSIVQDKVLSQASKNGSMLGPTYKTVDSELGKLASKYQGSNSAMEQEFGDAVAQLKNILNQQMRRSNPQVAQRLDALDEGWANLVRVEGAAKAAGGREGVFTPAQLQTAVRGADSSVRDRATARGTALMQDLSQAGTAVLSSRVPDSGTAGRVVLGGLLGAGSMVEPSILGGIGAGTALYTAPIQSLLRAAATARPALAQPLGNAVSRSAPVLLPAPLQGLLQPSE